MNTIDFNKTLPPSVSNLETSASGEENEIFISKQIFSSPVDLNAQMEITQLQFLHSSILLHAKGLFFINYGTFLKVRTSKWNIGECMMSRRIHSLCYYYFQLAGVVVTCLVLFIQFYEMLNK